MNTFPSFLRTGILSGAVLLGAGLPARAATDSEDAFPNFESYIKVSGLAPAITGNKSAFQNRARLPGDGGVGIEDLHYSRDLDKTTTMVFDGRALAGTEDYLGHLNLTKVEVGSFDIGYKRFRTFYDGVGGFFPLNRQWMPLANEDLHVDRSKFWVESTLNLPNRPVFSIRYTNELRDGRKDSTIWGDTDFTSLPNNVSPISQVRKIVPSYLDLDERHEVLELTARHTIKATTLQLTLLADRTDNADVRSVIRFPGEAKPFPTPAATVLLPAASMNNQVIIRETDGMQTQTTGANFESDTVFSEKVILRLAASYDLVHTTIAGGRPMITSTPTATGVVPVATDNYLNLSGGTRVKDFVGSVALDLKPTKTLFVKLALRAQDEFIRGRSSYTAVAATGTPAVTLTSTPRIGWARIHQNVQTPVVELRYTGFKNLALYFNGSRRSLNGEERNTSAYNPLTAASGTMANNDVSEDHGNYTLGANWRPSPALTLRAEVFTKGHKDNTVGFGATVGDYYLLDSQYTGFKVTAMGKISATISSTTRFISQHGQMQVTGFLPTYPAYDSLNARNYMISETIDWTPSKVVYYQLNGTLTYNVISTIYPRAGVTPATATAIAFDTNKVLQNSDNNYATGSFLTGFVIDRQTDAQVQATCYRAQNGNPILAPLTQPFGVDVRDWSVTVGLKHKFNDRLLGSAKVGYLKSDNATTGGFTNYKGGIGYVSLTYGL